MPVLEENDSGVLYNSPESTPVFLNCLCIYEVILDMADVEKDGLGEIEAEFSTSAFEVSRFEPSFQLLEAKLGRF